jgi:hypothetical protein
MNEMNKLNNKSVDREIIPVLFECYNGNNYAEAVKWFCANAEYGDANGKELLERRNEGE